jgi:hypothetical protein
MQIDESLGVVGKRLVRIVGAIDDLSGNFLRHVTRPTFRDIKADHPEGIFILSGDEVPDDGVTISLGPPDRCGNSPMRLRVGSLRPCRPRTPAVETATSVLHPHPRS